MIALLEATPEIGAVKAVSLRHCRHREGLHILQFNMLVQKDFRRRSRALFFKQMKEQRAGATEKEGVVIFLVQALLNR